MASQVSPGVIIRERDLTNTTIVNSQALRAAYAGAFQKGPVETPVAINSQKELLDTFGGPVDANAEDWFVASEFLNYGGRLVVSRAIGVNAATAASGSGEVSAVSEGSWANDIAVVAVDRGYDYIVTWSTAPATTANETEVTFDNGSTGLLYEYDSVTKKGFVIMTDGTPNAGDDGDGGTVAGLVDWYRNSSVTVGNFSIKLNSFGPRPGTSQQGADIGFAKDEFHVAVVSVSTGVILESFQYLSKLQGGKSPEGLNTYYRTSVNQGSANVVLAENPFSVVPGYGEDWTDGVDDSVETVAAGALAVIASQVLTLGGGDDDGYEYPNDALEIFRSYDATDIDFILMGGSKADENDTLAKAQTAVSIASERKDCVAFVSSHKGNQLGAGDVPLAVGAQKTNILNFFQNLASTSYAVFDSGYKYLYDRFNDVYRYVPCNGDVAGLCVATSAQLADWYSPAGLSRGSLRNAIKLAYNPSQADRDDLYSERINPIVSLRGSGITLFGDKTALSSPSAFDRINVRRLFLNIEKRVDTLAQGVLFSQNDSITRSGFSSAVSSYLSEIRADRGLTDFIVVCDDSNNTPSVIDRNEFVADIYLQPTRSINFITITLTATRTGVSFQEITGT